MRFFRESPPGAFLEVTGDFTYGATHVPYGNLAKWSEAERNAVGVFGVAEPVAPAGQIVASWHAARVDGIVQAVATYAAAPLPDLTFLEFEALFTPTEQQAIIASSDVNVRKFLIDAAGAQEIKLDDPRMAPGLNYLVSAGILTAERPAQILNNQPPA